MPRTSVDVGAVHARVQRATGHELVVRAPGPRCARRRIDGDRRRHAMTVDRPVRDDDERLVARQRAHGLLDDRLVLGVGVRRGLVEHDHGRVLRAWRARWRCAGARRPTGARPRRPPPSGSRAPSAVDELVAAARLRAGCHLLVGGARRCPCGCSPSPCRRTGSCPARRTRCSPQAARPRARPPARRQGAPCRRPRPRTRRSGARASTCPSPDGPTSAVTCPGSMARSTPWTTSSRP